jgi:hypothetical protein
MSDPLGDIAKKRKKSSLPAPEKVSTHFSASKASKSRLQKSQKNQVQRTQSPKVHATKVEPVRVKQQQQTRTQAPVYRNEDFQFATSVDNLGVNISITFQGSPIYKFLLPATDYDLWQRMNIYSQKYDYVKMKVPVSSFSNDAKLVHLVIKTIVNILTKLFEKAQAMQAQQQKKRF